jgi:hypothetical protein
VAGLARRRALDPHRHRRPAHRVVERDRHGGLEIGATDGSIRGAAPRAAEQPAEQVAEVAQILETDTPGEAA